VFLFTLTKVDSCLRKFSEQIPTDPIHLSQIINVYRSQQSKYNLTQFWLSFDYQTPQKYLQWSNFSENKTYKPRLTLNPALALWNWLSTNHHLGHTVRVKKTNYTLHLMIYPRDCVIHLAKNKVLINIKIKPNTILNKLRKSNTL